MAKHLINGCESSHISVLDRGLLYGDGLFETIWVHEGNPYYWATHLQRLWRGSDILALPKFGKQILETEIAQVCQKQSGILKIIITRGESERGYQLPHITNPTRIISFFPDVNPLADKNKFLQIKARICKVRLSPQPFLAGIKHLNRLEHIMARSEWRDDQIGEGILLTYNDHVISGTMTNLFFTKDNKVYTPKIVECGVRGIAREQIITYCHQQQISCEEVEVSLQQLLNADEIFLCNSIKGILAITEIEGYNHQFTTHFTHRFLKQALVFC